MNVLMSVILPLDFMLIFQIMQTICVHLALSLIVIFVVMMFALNAHLN